MDQKTLARYVETRSQADQECKIRTKIRQLVELNQWGPHSYSRDQLIEMLDNELAKDR